VWPHRLIRKYERSCLFAYCELNSASKNGIVNFSISSTVRWPPDTQPSCQHKDVLVAAASATWNILAFGTCLATRNANIIPSPIRAGSTSAENIDVGRTALDSARHAVERQISDRDATGWGSGRAAILIILLDDNAVVCNARKRNILVSHVGDRASGIVDSLNADTVLAVLHRGRFNGDALHGVVAAATDRADAQAMSSGASAASKGDVRSGVDSQAVLECTKLIDGQFLIDGRFDLHPDCNISRQKS